MKFQFEPICDQSLKHFMELIETGGGRGLGLNVIDLGIDPCWSAHNLAVRDLVHHLNHRSQRNIIRDIHLPAGQWTDHLHIAPRRARLD